jgi:hypothetical protein
MSAVRNETDRRGVGVPRGRRGFLAGAAAAVLALPLLPWGRKAGAQVYYDQYGRPVTVAPGTVVTPAAPAPAAAPPPGYGYYGSAGVVGQTRRVARRTSRRTGRREGVREDMWDAID